MSFTQTFMMINPDVVMLRNRQLADKSWKSCLFLQGYQIIWKDLLHVFLFPSTTWRISNFETSNFYAIWGFLGLPFLYLGNRMCRYKLWVNYQAKFCYTTSSLAMGVEVVMIVFRKETSLDWVHEIWNLFQITSIRKSKL